MKKRFCVLLCIVFIISLFACTNNKDEKLKELKRKEAISKVGIVDDKGVRNIKIGIVVSDLSDIYNSKYIDVLTDYIKNYDDKKIKYILTIEDARNTIDRQLSIVDTLLSEKCDALIIDLVSKDLTGSIIEKCANNNVPIVFINNEPDEEAIKMHSDGRYVYVGTDASQLYKYQGSIVANLPDKGDINEDKVLNYVLYKNDTKGISEHNEIDFSVLLYTNKTGYDINCLEKKNEMNNREIAYNSCINILEKEGNNIEVIFADNEDVTMGVRDAVIEAERIVGEDIYIIGAKAGEESVKAVKDGTITATVYNDYVTEAKTTIDTILNILNGVKVDLYKYIDYVKITKTSIE